MKRAAAIDVDRIVAFETAVMNRRLYGKPLDRQAVLSEIQTNEYYLDLRDECIAATGALRRRDDGSAYLSNIAVHPAMRRQGLARAMMRHLLSCCHDAPSIDLAVHPDNQLARALYASLAFITLNCQENFFGDGEPRLIMVRVRA